MYDQKANVDRFVPSGFLRWPHPKKPAKLPKLTFSGFDDKKADARLREAILYIASKCETADQM